jgi:antitoxin VapB
MDKVRIHRCGNAVVLEPIPQDWAWLDALIEPLDPDFVDAAMEQPSEQSRPDLAFFE